MAAEQEEFQPKSDLTKLEPAFREIADQLEASAASFKKRNPAMATMYDHFFNVYNHLAIQLKLDREERFINEFKMLGSDGIKFIYNTGLDEDQIKTVIGALKEHGLIEDEQGQEDEDVQTADE